jgi:NAD(P)-dependent dehydrogenase (short-subunit alcohol dehydrogenase family)
VIDSAVPPVLKPPFMSIRFDGKVAIVTGAGGGLGREHALELARRGARVVVNDLGGAVDGTGGSSEAARKVVAEIEAMGGEAIANGGSVSDRAGAQSMVDDAVKKWGTVDILINNAGILRDKSFKKMDLDDFEAVVKVHLLGSVYCTRAAFPVMEAKGWGRIVMTTSSSGLYGNFGQSNYGAAKFGLVGFMNTLKLEGGRKGVRVNTIAPVAATRMTADIGIPEEVLQKLKPELVTPAVLYLCSEDAPNGMIIEAGAGYYAQVQIVEGKGVHLGPKATVDDVAAAIGKITDMSEATPFTQGGDVTMKIFQTMPG